MNHPLSRSSSRRFWHKLPVISVMKIPAVTCLLLGTCLAPNVFGQPWSVPATNSTPPPPGIPIPTQPMPMPPPPRIMHPAVQRPALANQPLADGILAFDAEKKEYHAAAGEQNGAFVFNITNVSPQEVTIQHVQTSCGCTTAKIQLPMVLAPKQVAQIPINMNIAGKFGSVTKTVTIHSDRGQKTLLVTSIIPDRQTSTLTMGADRTRNQQIALANRQAVFHGDCARCHVEPLIGKTGKELYTAACGICHDAEHRASMVTDLHRLPPPTDAEYWRFFIINGKPGTLMPAFAQSQGGPLSDAQIASLVEYLVKDFPSSAKGQ